MITQVQIRSAVRTRALAHLPLLNASIAAKLVALLALLWLFDYHEADSASEIRVKCVACLRVLQVLVGIYALRHRSHELLDLLGLQVKSPIHHRVSRHHLNFS